MSMHHFQDPFVFIGPCPLLGGIGSHTVEHLSA